MKKKLFISFILAVLCSVCFAQTAKYRYAFITEQAVSIVDLKEKLPDEKLSDMVLSLNTNQERFIAESGFKRIKSYFYSGRVPFIYIDYTKNKDDPETIYIDTWNDVIAYVRGKK